jgi:hypothetical protein
VGSGGGLSVAPASDFKRVFVGVGVIGQCLIRGPILKLGLQIFVDCAAEIENELASVGLETLE